MKILLLGEYSGFFTNLKKGLLELGHEVTLASTSDGWKKIEGTDYQLYKCQNNTKLETIKECVISPYLRKKDLYGYDVVQIVGPVLYPLPINKIMLNSIINHSKKSFISVAGACGSLYDSYKSGLLGYYTFDDNSEECMIFDGKSKKSRKRNEQEKFIYENVDGIIPIMYEYSVGVRNRKNCMNTIPLPFDSSSVEYIPNIVNDKIRIAHGVIKEKHKGTSYIIEALRIIKERYPNDVEIAVDGKMPLKDYLEWLKSCNILIDQCKEHCYGLNALYAMAMGKIVFGGATKASLHELQVDSCPVVHIEPSVEQIVSQLERIIKKKNDYEKMGLVSRKYVEKVHNHITIANEYIKTWNSIQK